MASELNLGYDLFDAVMLPREVQAENMAKRLIALADTEEGYMFQGKWWNTLPNCNCR